MKNVFQWKFLVLLGFLVAGCNSGQRQSVHGTVTLDGAPLETGMIQFLPQSGTKGPSAGGEIKDGKFAVDSKKGVFAGKYRVEITSVRKTGKQMPVAGGGMTDEMRNVIPAKYNQNSELIFDASSDTAGTCDFALNAK
jgi:hypothetical protein